jgi:hypothetical protein
MDGLETTDLRVKRLWQFPAKALLAICALNLSGSLLFAGPPRKGGDNPTELARYAMKLPDSGLVKIQPKVPSLRLSKMDPMTFRRYLQTFADNNRSDGETGRYPWKPFITTTVFWIGEQPTVTGGVSNDKSAWDGDWFSSYGGYDDPSVEGRRNFVPISFLPRQNPFYVALPYNDVDEQHHTKPGTAQLIPWFNSAFVRDGQSVCKGRWIEIRRNGRVCYAQWEDVGPFQTDDFGYVFGNQRPMPNRNGDAGLDVSPAVRDYLGLKDIDFCDWRFVDFIEVPRGPWAFYGDNNTFLQRHIKAVAVVKRSAKPF